MLPEIVRMHPSQVSVKGLQGTRDNITRDLFRAVPNPKEDQPQGEGHS